MKKLVSLLLGGLLLATTLTGCLASDKKEEVKVDPVTYKTSDEVMEFTFPGTWVNETGLNKDAVGELRVAEKEKALYQLVFTYDKKTLASKFTPDVAFKAVIEDIQGKRTNFTPIKENESITAEGKSIIQSIYSGENNGTKYNYIFSLIQFDSNKDYFAVVLQTCPPENLDKNQESLLDIIKSAKILK